MGNNRQQVQDSLGDENILELDSGGGCTTLWKYQNHWTVYFKMVNFMVHEPSLKSD